MIVEYYIVVHGTHTPPFAAVVVSKTRDKITYRAKSKTEALSIVGYYRMRGTKVELIIPHDELLRGMYVSVGESVVDGKHLPIYKAAGHEMYWFSEREDAMAFAAMCRLQGIKTSVFGREEVSDDGNV
jgi:hypothetical protein